jgi:hypothetical protein
VQLAQKVIRRALTVSGIKEFEELPPAIPGSESGVNPPFRGRDPVLTWSFATSTCFGTIMTNEYASVSASACVLEQE